MSPVKGIVSQFVLVLACATIAASQTDEAVMAAHTHAVQIARLRSDPTPSVSCIAKNCLKQSVKCFANGDCRSALGCSKQKHGRFQCIQDHENEVYDELVYCMFNEHDCMGTKKTFDPYQMCKAIDKAAPMTQYQGKPLTTEVARHLLTRGTDHRGDWLVALGKSPAFDCFDCQYSYWGYKADQTMYYHADYKIHRSNGDIRWQSSESVVSSNWLNNTVGRFALIAPNDSGLYREDDWRMLAVDESQSTPAWIAMYYCGGAPGVANAYEGAMVLTPDGQVPTDPKAMTIINDVFANANVTLKCNTDNSHCSGHPVPPQERSAVMV